MEHGDQTASLKSVLQRDVVASDGRALVVGADVRKISRVVQILSREDSDGRVDVLTNEGNLSSFADQTLLASRADQLVQNGQLSLRSTGPQLLSGLITTSDGVYAEVGESKYLPVQNRSASDSDIRQSYAPTVKDFEPYQLGAIDFGRLERTLSEHVVDGVGKDLAEALNGVTNFTDSRAGCLSLVAPLLTAKHNGFLHDLGEWAEELGIRSNSTISRYKTRLSDAGLVTTEKVRVGLGSPRQRLMLTDEELKQLSPSELIQTSEDWIYSD
ncbi:hypothetical protein EXE48_12335 [Halorubrum sp. ASP1]|uniref:transcriptional regulator TbsP domain-containing protein n=1 Tax=Halorubrum sp. ASP1 TaxID=2518114 RepID=UPI0010F5EF2E|nr:DUF5821 family protein [Halorubrum sp. ASP1]TKX60753.1 hypothetical protein EXE48_12335 [Halorubrum sp. ASP1]